MNSGHRELECAACDCRSLLPGRAADQCGRVPSGGSAWCAASQPSCTRSVHRACKDSSYSGFVASAIGARHSQVRGTGRPIIVVRRGRQRTLIPPQWPPLENSILVVESLAVATPKLRGQRPSETDPVHCAEILRKLCHQIGLGKRFLCRIAPGAVCGAVAAGKSCFTRTTLTPPATLRWASPGCTPSGARWASGALA
jgi:hypothetical protein